MGTQGGKELIVRRLNVGKRSGDQGTASGGQPQPARPIVRWIECSLKQAAGLQLARHLARHHRIGAGLLG